MFAALGRYLSNRENFVRYALICIGVPLSICVSWWYWAQYSALGIVFWLFMLGVAFVVAYVWGILMWKILFQRPK